MGVEPIFSSFLATMDPLKVLKHQIFIFKVFGIWSKNRKVLNYFHIFFAFYFISIVFIITLLISLLFVNTMKQVIDHLIVLNSSILAFLKGLVIYFKHSKHMELFEIIEKLDVETNLQSRQELIIVRKVKKLSDILSYGFAACYVFAWISLAVQSIFGGSEQMFWPSTSFFPGEISENRMVFWVVFVFQAFSGLVLVFALFASDTYGIIMIIILNGHIDVLSLRISNLGYGKVQTAAVAPTSPSSNASRIVDASLELIKCIKTFYTCLR